MHTTKHVGLIGLGKMGQNIAVHLLEQGIDVSVYNRTEKVTLVFTEEAENQIQKWRSEDDGLPIGSLKPARSMTEFVASLPQPKVILLMVKAGKPVDEVIKELLAQGVSSRDIIIDAGNSFFEDSKRRHDELKKKQIHYIDCGTSGGLEGARFGACLMLGGDKKVVANLAWLWDAITGKGGCFCSNEESQTQDCGDDCCAGNYSHGGCCSDESEAGWTYFGPSGAGHFVKMVHNGVEYGMNQAIGEGFDLLANGPYKLDLADVASNWNRGSVVRGWLMELLSRALDKDGQLSSYKGIVGGGETGTWTIETAKQHNISQPILAEAIKARERSQKHPTFATKVVSALRYEYGGHKEEVSDTQK